MRQKTQKKLDMVNALVSKGNSIKASCKEIGLATQTYYLHHGQSSQRVRPASAQPMPASTKWIVNIRPNDRDATMTFTGKGKEVLDLLRKVVTE